MKKLLIHSMSQLPTAISHLTVKILSYQQNEKKSAVCLFIILKELWHSAQQEQVLHLWENVFQIIGSLFLCHVFFKENVFVYIFVSHTTIKTIQ